MDVKENLEFSEQKITDVGLAKEVKKSFIDYSMSVIMSRALPDVRDGLKPVHRRILYAMYEDHLTHDKPFRKSATTVGNVLGRYHPHGDAAVYDTMVRMAQTFSLRYPLIEGHGNFGNIDGDPAAAYRYTESRMHRISDEMMRDIEKDVVDFMPNFDNKMKEPTILPSRFPNLLVNGSIGIAVGMATNIPPHNMGEVVDGTIFLMENPDAEVTQLLDYIKGPDFPTGATICGSQGIYSAYTTGKGRIIVRAKTEIDEDKHRIIIREIPYQVNKTTLVESMAACVKDKRIEGIRDIRDESSGRTGIRVVVECKHDANCQIILNQLYKYTQLQDTCAVNMLALVDNIPKILNLKDVLSLYIKHQEDVIVRRTKFELEKALHEAHINEGYKIATDNIDEVINIIRASASIPDAKVKLCERFGLSEIQAQAIVEMTLGRLSGLERQKVEDRLAKLYMQIEELRSILADENKVKEIIKTDLLEIKRKYADARKTECVPLEEEIVLEDLIERHRCLITLSHAGYIKRRAADSYSAQHRGGKGIIGMTTKEEDFVEMVVSADSHSNLMMFTSKGKVFTKKAYLIPEAGRTAKGTNIANILEIDKDDKITAMIDMVSFDMGGYLTMVTRNGIIKRTPVEEYEYQRKGGKKAINLDEGDELVFVAHTTGENEIVIATKNGFAVRFEETKARQVGRTSRGVIAIRLTDGDCVAGASIVDDSKTLLFITENGFGKRTEFKNFPCHNRGGKGVICHKLSDKTGRIADIAAVDESDDVMLITNDGTVIRTPVSGISTYGRTAAGVIVMRLSEGASIVNFAKVQKEDEEDEAEAEDNE
ncbi:MAG: DNA gyrase subunit A [Ruminococcaceae bacterium]|nr:DNA gyrase subunit A [Oscillospiraceae bacterium]